MTFQKLLTFGILAALVVSCSSTKPFQPFSNGYGWSDYDLAPDRSEVSFSGRVGDNLTHVKKMALIRAAQIGRSKRFKFMRVIQTQSYLVRGVSFELLEKYAEPSPLSFSRNETPVILRDTSAKSIELADRKAPNARLEVRMIVRYCDKDCTDYLEVQEILTNASRDGWIK